MRNRNCDHNIELRDAALSIRLGQLTDLLARPFLNDGLRGYRPWVDDIAFWAFEERCYNVYPQPRFDTGRIWMRGSAVGLLEELIATFERVDAPPSTVQAEVYERICAALMEGRLRPGQAISIRNLAAAMNTSPMPVREALRRLEAIQVIKQQPGRVITVAELSVAELQEIRDIRVLLEGFAAKLATKTIATRGIDRLARIADDMHRQWETTTDIGRMLRANREFHFAIYQASKRPILVSMIKSLWLRVAPFFYEICRDNGHVDFSIEQHLRAVDALRKRDPEGVAKAIAADIGVAADRLVGHALDREGASTSPRQSAQNSQKAC